MKKRCFAFFAASCALAFAADAFNPPTMGWSSWNTFALNINEDVIKSQADAMVATGLSDAGYKFINIDDGFWDGRGEDGKLILNTKLFPGGMRRLVDYIHGKGLKAGIYSDAGDNTCGSGNKSPWGLGVGLAGHEEEDCHLYFIDWDFDFIKVDYCGGIHMNLDERDQYTKISNVIKNCGKPGIVYNVCRWAYPGTWISDVADSWRTTGDIFCEWPSVKAIILENLYIQAFTGGGHYNDADMLEIGRTLSPDEENTHMAYWCIASSPLLIGCDMTTIPESSLELLKNKDLIAMNQDKLGIGAPVVQRDGEVYVVAKDMEKVMGPKRAVVVMNLSDENRIMPVSLDAVGFEGDVAVYDCFTHKDVAGKANGTFYVDIPAHGSAAYFMTGKRAEKQVYQAEEAYLPAYQELGKGETAMWANAVSADQGAYVGYLGNAADNTIDWNEVYSEKGGDYVVSIRFASAEPRDMELSVNGKPVKTFTNVESGDYTRKWGMADAEIRLQKGFNKISLGNATGWMPNIDSITLRKL